MKDTLKNNQGNNIQRPWNGNSFISRTSNGKVYIVSNCFNIEQAMPLLDRAEEEGKSVRNEVLELMDDPDWVWILTNCCWNNTETYDENFPIVWEDIGKIYYQFKDDPTILGAQSEWSILFQINNEVQLIFSGKERDSWEDHYGPWSFARRSSLEEMIKFFENATGLPDSPLSLEKEKVEKILKALRGNG